MGQVFDTYHEAFADFQRTVLIEAGRRESLHIKWIGVTMEHGAIDIQNILGRAIDVQILHGRFSVPIQIEILMIDPWWEELAKFNRFWPDRAVTGCYDLMKYLVHLDDRVIAHLHTYRRHPVIKHGFALENVCYYFSQTEQVGNETSVVQRGGYERFLVGQDNEGASSRFLTLFNAYREPDLYARDQLFPYHRLGDKGIPWLRELFQRIEKNPDGAMEDLARLFSHAMFHRCLSKLEKPLPNTAADPAKEQNVLSELREFLAHSSGAITAPALAVKLDHDAQIRPDSPETIARDIAKKESGNGQLKLLTPAIQKAWLAYIYAETKQEKRLQDKEAWDFLVENGIGPDGETIEGYKPPSFETFSRQLREARKILGENKYTRRRGRPPARSVIPAESIDNRRADIS